MIAGGFGLIRREPGAVLVWGAVSAASGAALAYVALRLGIATDADSVMRRAGAGMVVQPLLQLALNFLSLLISTILSAAAFRAVLRPGSGGLAHLRLGSDEWRMIAITVILYVLGVIAVLVLSLGFGFLASFAGLVGGDSPVTAVAIGLIGLALLGGMVFVFVRLSLVYPLVLIRRRISLDDSWELTRGHFWSLLGAYILMALISLALAFLVFLPLLGVQVRYGGSVDYWNQALRPMVQSGAAPGVSMVLVALLSVAMGGVMLALWGGMIATAARQLIAAEDRLDLRIDA